MSPETPNTNDAYDEENTNFPGGSDDEDDSGNEIHDGQGMEIADPNDFFHRRDADDQLQPVMQKIPGREQSMRVVPPTTGDFQKFHLDEPAPLYEDDELYAEFLNRFFPDLDTVSAQDVSEGMIGYGAEMFVDLAQRAGGKDMKEALDGREMQRFMEMVGDEDGNVDFQKLVQAGEGMDE